MQILNAYVCELVQKDLPNGTYFIITVSLGHNEKYFNGIVLHEDISH